ncbi:bifunctional diguanylate cyclase/phosphodiesterase [Lysinibacillus sp. BW-2-10]|uniref:putative bifunctional diguanylate cyclase/phosphodiesterase n=1 Tax=Lysinibacillus sp. BW-2-10 TaxID=2590030 RepID=UPI0011812A95|nr:bifunctional diguanylate cyclase/phosphodiesterase [Lysinibacillus sp. BW-2-10]TSI04191.1 bifunctional diguanylate cyclase/phosphodiesterase [Lysinibacillus sp. BW-2-10]
MINFPIMEIEDYLRDILKLNPFEAVIILKQQERQAYSVEMINSKASILSPVTFSRGMDAKQFFQGLHWDQLVNIIQNSNGELNYISVDEDKKRLSFYVQPVSSKEDVYFILIIKQVLQDNTPFSLLTFQDENTGLLNRRALNVRWSEHYRDYKDDKNIALLLIDLDRFKKYNESLGKHNADIMIKKISERFNDLRNEQCELFHYNGDEFILLVRYYLREEVDLIANQIFEKLKDSFFIDGQEYFVTCSIGISTILNDQSRDLETMLLQAEQALFYVKKHGRAHYRFYREEMSHTFQNEVLMESHLRRAIEFNELIIHLQPQIDFETNEIDSFEALIRWNNPKFGFVPPSQFIPLAESSGLIIQIGDWVLEEVCKYQKQWREKGYRPVRVAVNISPKQFKQEQFTEKIKMILEKYEVEPKYIELEITESSMENVDETQKILTNLKALGVYVSVDDFGTGYSSLSYLKKYPIDIIKIDQSFIADLNKDEKNEAIVKAIIALSQNLGMDVIAEGVEELSQEVFLKQHRCKKGQGYLYNKPLPVEEIIEQYLIR